MKDGPMRKVIKTVFLYSELSDAAKSVARQWWSDASAGDDFGADFIFADAAEIAAIMGIDLRQTPKSRMDGTSFVPSLYYSGFYNQVDGASFKGTYKYKKGACKALKAYAPKDVELQRICKTLKDAQRKVFYLEETISQALRDFADWIYSALEKEYEYRNSAAAVEETLVSNGYEFNGDGTIA